MAISLHGHTSAEAIESSHPKHFGDVMMRLALNSLHRAMKQASKDCDGKPFKIIAQSQTSAIVDRWLFITTTLTIETNA